MTDQLFTAYFQHALHHVQIYPLEHGTYFGYIPRLPGLFAEGQNAATVRHLLQNQLSVWLASMLYLGLPIPSLDGIDLSLEQLGVGVTDDS